MKTPSLEGFTRARNIWWRLGVSGSRAAAGQRVPEGSWRAGLGCGKADLAGEPAATMAATVAATEPAPGNFEEADDSAAAQQLAESLGVSAGLLVSPQCRKAIGGGTGPWP